MVSRLRRREEIPEGTPIEGVFKDVKLEHGKFGRQIPVNVLVTKGDYKGTQFPDWFSFAKDSDGEEYIPYRTEALFIRYSLWLTRTSMRSWTTRT